MSHIDQLPQSLRLVEPARSAFNGAAQEPIKTQERRAPADLSSLREKTMRGSNMVINDKPVPVLKPPEDRSMKREAFNTAWMHEARAAALEYLRAQRQETSNGQVREYAAPIMSPRR